MLLASLIALAGAVFVGTPEEIEKKTQEVRAEAARQARAMQQQKSATATDPAAPDMLLPPSDMTLAQLRGRRDIVQAQNHARQFGTTVAPGLLPAMAASVGCAAEGGVQAIGTASDKTRPAVLNGAALLATCPDEAFLSIAALPVATPTGGGAVVFPEFYTLAVAGRPALKYYFKNASGRQLEMLFLLDGQMQQTHYTLQYWSQGDGGQKAMTGARRLDTLVLP